jgi:glycine betaine catabolism B
MNVRFIDSNQEAEDIWTFRFDPERPVDYIAGQFIDLSIGHEEADARGNRRWFTLSSSPTEPWVSITTRLTAGTGSSFKRALLALHPGEIASISDPMGDFVLPKDVTIPITFVAAGIGITPVRSMIKWMHDIKQPRTVQLIYAARSLENMAFRDLFKQYQIPTTILLSRPPKDWSGPNGRLEASKVLQLSSTTPDKLYYLSGPEPLIEQLVADMADAGIARSQLVTDYFLNYTSV